MIGRTPSPDPAMRLRLAASLCLALVATLPAQAFEQGRVVQGEPAVLSPRERVALLVSLGLVADGAATPFRW